MIKQRLILIFATIKNISFTFFIKISTSSIKLAIARCTTYRQEMKFKTQNVESYIVMILVKIVIKY